MMKIREHGNRIWEIHRSRAGLVYSPTTGGMGREVTFYRLLADLLASKHGWTYTCACFVFVAVCHHACVYGAADPSP